MSRPVTNLRRIFLSERKISKKHLLYTMHSLTANWKYRDNCTMRLLNLYIILLWARSINKMKSTNILQWSIQLCRNKVQTREYILKQVQRFYTIACSLYDTSPLSCLRYLVKYRINYAILLAQYIFLFCFPSFLVLYCFVVYFATYHMLWWIKFIIIQSHSYYCDVALEIITIASESW